MADEIMFFANSGAICRKPTNLDGSFRSREITSISETQEKKEDYGFGFINIDMLHIHEKKFNIAKIKYGIVYQISM